MRHQTESLRLDAGHEPPIPESIGPYKLLEMIGRGGMGIVYRAIQPVTERQVAVKVMWDTLESQRRFTHYFEREVRALGRLNHPNIARVYESGQTEHGRRFIVMELIEGIAIDRYVRQHHPKRQKVLQLFVEICDAISHAHERGVLHRDIKPSNIMITPDAKVRILDFGLARLSEAPSSADYVTTTGHLMGTFPYMSPEQLERRDAMLTDQSDVYSLGVVLYELLTGQLPFTGGHSHKATMDAVCRGEYVRPKSVDQSIDCDLSTIVETALENDPLGRYASAAALGEDIKRYLTDRPILARPLSSWYRLGKAVRRHRAASAIAAGVFMILLSSSVISTMLFLQVRTEANNSRQINEFMQSVFTAANPDRSGRGISVRQMLDNASERLETELSNQPATRASLHRALGLTYLGLGIYSSADAQLQEAMDLRRIHHGESSIEFAESMCDLGESANTRYNPWKATPLFEDALAIYRRSPREHPAAEARCLRGLGVATYTVGTFLSDGPISGINDLDYYRDAVESLSEAIDILERRGLKVPATYHMDLGGAFKQLKNYTASESAYLDSIRICQQEHGDKSVTEAYIRFDYAQLFEARGEFEAAESMFRMAIGMQRELLGNGHPTLALTLARFADFLSNKLCAYQEAEKHYLEALHLRSNFEDSEQFRRSANKYELRLSTLYTNWGKPDRAIEIIQERAQRAIKNPHKSNLKYLVLTGDAYLAASQYSTADAYYQALITFVEAVQPRKGSINTLYARTLSGRAKVLAAYDKLKDAEALARQSVDILRSLLAGDDSRLADSLFVLGEIQIAQSKYEEAAHVLGECLLIRQEILTNQHNSTATAQCLYHKCVAAFEKGDLQS